MNERKKTGNGYGKKEGFIIAFALPVIIMIAIFIERGIFPFGENSFLRTDMYHQYAPFFAEMKYKLAHGGSLFYSWNIGMGVNFSALYAYYLASPLNWLVALVPQNHVIEFMTYLIVFKIGLSGLSFSYYLSRHSKGEDAGIGFFGIFYALSGYMAAYSWNIMWLDCIWLFPLICLGAERLVFRKKRLLYTITLGLSILSNYYISIMVCIFLIFYFFVLQILKHKNTLREFVQSGVRFAFYSLLAGALSAVVLLPEIYALQHTASSEISFPQTFTSYFSIFDMLARHMPNVEVEIGLDHWPNIYCGTGIFLLLILYFCNKKLRLREKAVYGGMLLFFLASFSINVLNYIWHGLHYPNSLPARQSFIYIFLVLYLCFKAYNRPEGNEERHLHFAIVLSLGFILLAQKLITDEGFFFGVFYWALALTCLYGLLLHLRLAGRASQLALGTLALILVVVEASINTTGTSVTTVNRTTYTEDWKDVKYLVEKLPKGDFYRFDKVNRKTKNDGAFMNFPSESLFSSTAQASLSNLFQKLGNEASTNAYSITGQTPLMDMLFAIKYGLYTGTSENSWLKLVEISGDTYLYENPYTLPLAYGIPQDMEKGWMLDLGNPVDVQNDLSILLNTDPTLVEVESGLEGQEVRFEVPITGLYYAYVTAPAVDQVIFETNDGTLNKTFDNVKRHYLLELGNLVKGETATLRGEEEGDFDARVYRFDYMALKAVFDKLGTQPMTITHFSDTNIQGSVDFSEEGTLFTSIPYDKGWKVTVDGKPAETHEVFSAFLGVTLTKGKHTLEFSYMPQGLYAGALLTGGAVLLLVLIYLLSKTLEKRKKRGKGRISWKNSEGKRALRMRKSKADAVKSGEEPEEALVFDEPLEMKLELVKMPRQTLEPKQSLSEEDEDRFPEDSDPDEDFTDEDFIEVGIDVVPEDTQNTGDLPSEAEEEE